ncbi:MAG: MXAN_6640 family putative metalloprotease, partial [Cytophagaceae bacterium]
MKKNYFFLFSMLLPLSLSAQQSGYSSALIAKSEEMKTINVEKCAHGSFHHCCHTDLFTEARKNQASLTTQAQAYFKTTVLRPTLSGTALVYNTPHFAIHYTKSGLDAVPLADVNPANSIPDYVDFMAAVFDTVYVRAQREKYTMPPSDGTAGGSALYDVYIQQLGVGLYGYCQPETQVNDNPNSPAIVETDAMTSYMAMNNSYTWTTSTDTSVKVTCAHEFFHAIQFGYESNDSDFLYEATAVWMEDHRFPGLDDNLQYLPDFFQDPDVALDWSDYVDGSAYSGHFYSSWIYFKHMTDYTADSIIKTILINSINNSDLVGIDLALQDYGKNFKDDFRDFLIANLLLIDSLNYPQYSYPRADVYKNYIAQVPYNLSGPKIEGTINYTGTYQDFLSYSSGNSRLMRLSADYINIFPNQNCYINMIPV